MVEIRTQMGSEDSREDSSDNSSDNGLVEQHWCCVPADRQLLRVGVG
jgi:hypothetical protein